MPEVKQGYEGNEARAEVIKHWEAQGYWLINTHQFPDRNYGWRYPDGTIHKDLPDKKKRVKDGNKSSLR